MRCTKANCGGSIDIRTDGIGRVTYHCAQCTRKRARLCRDCPARTPTPWFWRCAPCAKKHRRAFERARDHARYADRRADVLANHAKRRADPVRREFRKQYMADYRRRHPRDDQDRAYNRAYMAACRANPVYRARELRRKRKLRRAQRQAA